MKRSQINAALREMEDMLRAYRVSLPEFCGFTTTRRFILQKTRHYPYGL